MPSFAEMLAGNALEGSQKVGNGLAQAFQGGAQLAVENERVQQNRQSLEIQRAQLEQAKMSKFAEAVEKGQQYSGKAQKNYYDKFLPAFRDSLGLTKAFSDDTLKFMTASPENLGRVQTLVSDVRNGLRTAPDVIKLLQDPVAFADVTIGNDIYKQLGEADKVNVENRQAIKKQTMEDAAKAKEKKVERDATGQVELDKKTADAFNEYQNKGGAAAWAMASDAYQNAIDALSKDKATGKPKVQLGTISKKIPFGNTDAVLSSLDPDAKALMDTIRNNVNIRTKSGDPNPTEKQIENILARSIDPRLDNEKNIEKLKAEKERMDAEHSNMVQSFTKAGHMAAPAKGGKTLSPKDRKRLEEQLRAQGLVE